MNDTEERHEEGLNHRAWKAALGFALEPEARIAELLRADVTIYPYVREAIADLFERRSANGIVAKISGHKKNRDYSDRLDALEEKLTQGRKLRALDMSRAEMLEHFKAMPGTRRRGSSPSLADKAISYSNRCDAWVEQALMQPGRPGLSQEERRLQLERYFHRFEAAGIPLDKRAVPFPASHNIAPEVE